jgi:hypothetical protein
MPRGRRADAATATRDDRDRPSVLVHALIMAQRTAG